MGDQIPSDRPGAQTVPAESSAAVQELAQAFLTLEHALLFYPEGHQTRTVPLARLLDLLRAEARDGGEASLGCAGESVLWRGAPLEEPPLAVRKLAALLGSSGIARLSWTAGLTEDELRVFMTQVAAARAAGHRAVWEGTERYEHLRVEGADYRSLMAASGAPEPSGLRRDLWRALLLRSLGAVELEPSEEDLALLRESWGDPADFASLVAESVGSAAHAGDPEAVGPMRRVAALVERAAAADAGLPPGAGAERLAAMGRELPEPLRLRLLEATLDEPTGGLFDAAFGSLTPGEGAALLGANFSLESSQIERLARVFQHLVPRQLDRMELIPRLREAVPRRAEDEPLADNVWEEVQELLTGEAGDFMSPAYQDQLRRLAAREADRRDQEAALAEMPELTAALAPARTAGESLLIQVEQLRLATNVERYRDALEGLAGLCTSALLVGDHERGLQILGRLLEARRGEEPLAGPRADIDRLLQALASAPVLLALVPLLPSLSREQRDAVQGFVAVACESAAPALLDALAAEEDGSRRKEILSLLEQAGPGVGAAVLRALEGASPAAARLMLPFVAEAGDPGAAPVLLSLLRRDDAKLRRDALRALLRIDTEEVRRALPRLLEDADLEIVQAAAAHLGTVGSPETVRELLRALDGGLFAGRRADQMQRAVFVLGRMRAAEAVAPLGELLLRRAWINRRVREQVSEEAAQALARIGGTAARRMLEKAAARGSGKVAALCRRLLARSESE